LNHIITASTIYFVPTTRHLPLPHKILIIALFILTVLADSSVVLIFRISFICFHGLYKTIPLARNAPHPIGLAHHTKRHHLQYQVHTIFKVLPSSHESIWVHGELDGVEGHLQGAKNCSQVGHAENYQHSDDESEEAEITIAPIT
jgi:hypothetical protein